MFYIYNTVTNVLALSRITVSGGKLGGSTIIFCDCNTKVTFSASSKKKSAAAILEYICQSRNVRAAKDNVSQIQRAITRKVGLKTHCELFSWAEICAGVVMHDRFIFVLELSIFS